MRVMICDICGTTENNALFLGRQIRTYKRIVYKSGLMGTRVEYEDVCDICDSCIERIKKEIGKDERK